LRVADIRAGVLLHCEPSATWRMLDVSQARQFIEGSLHFFFDPLVVLADFAFIDSFT